MIKSLNWRKIALFSFVVAMASCSLPPDSRAAIVDLTWQDNSTSTGTATATKVYENTPLGVVLPGLTGRWTLVATPAITPDVDPATPGKQNTYAVLNVTAGVHTYVVVASNSAGDSPPSNTADVTVLSAPTSHTLLTATIRVE